MSKTEKLVCLVTDPASKSYLQYSVPLLKVRHVALLTQGALSSIHCRAVSDERQVREWTTSVKTFKILEIL